MSNPWVRDVGHVEDEDGITVTVGVDYAHITIGEHELSARTAVKLLAFAFDALSLAAEQGAMLADDGDQADEPAAAFPPPRAVQLAEMAEITGGAHPSGCRCTDL